MYTRDLFHYKFKINLKIIKLKQARRGSMVAVIGRQARGSRAGLKPRSLMPKIRVGILLGPPKDFQKGKLCPNSRIRSLMGED